MSTSRDTSTASGTESAEAVTISLEEYDRLRGMGAVAAEPAFEEGPHLKDPEVRAAKRAQMRDAGIKKNDDRLTDDMRAILAEGDD